jgi:secretion/DNA translocation related TadE-like protein
MSSPGFAVDRRCCPEWSSSAKLFRRLSRDETGSATVLAAALVAALVAVALGGVSVGAAAVARHRAQAAADLAALAAAGRLPLGPQAACDQARSIATAMGAAVSGCDIQNLDVVVAVTVRPGGRIAGEARAAARAGPAGRA